MQIKPSPLEQQAIIKLPKVTPQNEKKRPETPKASYHKK